MGGRKKTGHGEKENHAGHRNEIRKEGKVRGVARSLSGVCRRAFGSKRTGRPVEGKIKD